MKKKRADELLYEHGHCESRQDAALLIMAGKVRSGKDALVTKPSQEFPADTVLTVDSGNEFVSRGARKLKDALEKFAPDLAGKTAADIGASTGGFTDLMLSHGAEKVYAVDVGRGLLHWKLRSDPRVICLEGVNARTPFTGGNSGTRGYPQHGRFVHLRDENPVRGGQRHEAGRHGFHSGKTAVRGTEA